MVRHASFLVMVLSLACLLAWGPAALAPRAAAQERSGPPPRQGSQGERRSRWERPPGDRGPGEGRGGRGRPRPADSGGERSDRGPRGARESSSSSSRSSSSSSSSTNSRYRSYASELVAKHDKNGDNMLKGDELAGLGDMAAKYDRNGDGTVTDEEIFMFHVAPGADGTSPASSDSRGGGKSDNQDGNQREGFGSGRRQSGNSSSTSAASSGGPDQAERITNDAAKSYRFKSAKERLPDGLPSFFSRDANGDGQISMSEYSSRWSDRTVEEFRRYDLNGDGIVTPKECLKR